MLRIERRAKWDLFETDEKGRIKGATGHRRTLQVPDALTPVVLHLPGRASEGVRDVAATVTWISRGWTASPADPARVVEVLDRCDGVHHLSLALAALAEVAGGEVWPPSHPPRAGQSQTPSRSRPEAAGEAPSERTLRPPRAARAYAGPPDEGRAAAPRRPGEDRRGRAKRDDAHTQRGGGRARDDPRPA